MRRTAVEPADIAGVPTPRDRTRGVRLAVRCIEYLERHAVRVKLDPRLTPKRGRSERPITEIADDEPDVAVIGIQGAQIRLVGLDEVEANADMKCRRSKNPWWIQLVGLIDVRRL